MPAMVSKLLSWQWCQGMCWHYSNGKSMGVTVLAVTSALWYQQWHQFYDISIASVLQCCHYGIEMSSVLQHQQWPLHYDTSNSHYESIAFQTGLFSQYNWVRIQVHNSVSGHNSNNNTITILIALAQLIVSSST